jgi:hypothetical protein
MTLPKRAVDSTLDSRISLRFFFVVPAIHASPAQVDQDVGVFKLLSPCSTTPSIPRYARSMQTVTPSTGKDDHLVPGFNEVLGEQRPHLTTSTRQ